MATIRDVTYQLLRDAGIRTIFGNPGSTEEPFLQNFPADFQYIMALQEASVVGMADGYAQITHQPAIVNLHTDAGVGNAMGNIMTAKLNQTALLITAGQQTREMLLLEPRLTNVQAPVLPQPRVKWAYEPCRPEDVPAAFVRGLATTIQAPDGPAFLSIPLDDWDHECLRPPAARTVASRVGPDPERLAEFAQRLANAKSPALIYGSSIDRQQAWQDGIALAEHLNAPVWIAPAPARMPFPTTHPLYQGVLPFAIAPLASKLEGYDVVLAIGCPIFSYYPYVAGDYLPAGTQLLHITDDPDESARAPVGDSLISDSRLAIQALQTALSKLPSAPRTPPAPRKSSTAAPTATPSEGWSALQVFEVLHAASPDNSVLVAESPSNLQELRRAWPIDRPESFFVSASGGLGWALPAAVGIALAERDIKRNRPVVLVIGDGSYQYSLQALWTAVQHRLPMVIAVMKNSQYAILKSFAVQEDSPNVPGLDIPGIDNAALAEGYGCKSVRLNSLNELAHLVKDAWTTQRPTVIEIPINRDVPPLLR